MGVGTANPLFKFDVAGIAQIQDYLRTSFVVSTSTATSTFSGGLYGSLISAPYFHATSTTATSTFAGGLSVAGTAGLTVLQNGNVGVGTTIPNDKLSISGDLNLLDGSGLKLTKNSISTGVAKLLNGMWTTFTVPTFQPVSNGGMALDIIPKGPAADVWIDVVSNDVFSDNANYETLKLLKKANGDAEILTTAAGTGTQRGLKISNSGWAIYPSLAATGEMPAGVLLASQTASFWLASSGVGATAGEKVVLSYHSSPGWMSGLEVANVSSGYSNLLLMKSGGNVGIGTTTPTAQLQVTTSAANATTSVQFGKANQNKGTCMTLYDTNGSPVYAFIAAGATAFTLQNGGTAPSGCKN